jgi:hypothetical protein
VHVTLGGRVKVADVTDMRGTLKLRPVIGLRYGRWRFGVGDASDWLRFSGYRKEATLSYDWLDSQRASLRLSLRVHNLATGEGVDAFEAGRHTLRGRAQFNYALTSRWSLGGELTHDLLDRGDGQTLGAGASYRWPLDPRRAIYFNGGVTWGSARHWTHWRHPWPSGRASSPGWCPRACRWSARSPPCPTKADDERQRHLVAALRAEVNAAPPLPARWRSTRASSPTSTAP